MSDNETSSIHQGDAFDLLPELETASAHAAVVDFPWHFESGRLQDLEWQKQHHGYLVDLFDELSRILERGCWMFVMADDTVYPEFRRKIESSPFEFQQTLIWDKEKMGMGHYFRVSHQPILAATNGPTKRFVQDRKTILRSPLAESDYPTAKPVRLYRQLLKPPVLKDGERLIEPFAGSAPGYAVTRGRGCDYWGCDTEVGAVDTAESDGQQSQLTESGAYDG